MLPSDIQLRYSLTGVIAVNPPQMRRARVLSGPLDQLTMPTRSRERGEPLLAKLKEELLAELMHG